MGGTCRNFRKKKQNTYRILVGRPQWWQPFGSLVLDGRVIFKYRKQVIIIYLDIQIQKTNHNNLFGQGIPCFYVNQSFLSELTEPHYRILS
jgi:hypothetical protein